MKKVVVVNFKIVIVSFFIILCTSPCHSASRKTMMMVNKNAAVIDKACKASKDYDLCLSILNGDSRSVNADIPGLTIIVLEYAISKAKETIGLVNKLATNTTEKLYKVCLESCVDEYQNYIGFCQTSISDVKQNLVDAVQLNTDYAAQEEIMCEICFSQIMPPHKSPITNENQLNARLVDIAAYMFWITKK